MASKKYIELQEFTDDELKNELSQTQEQFQKLQFDHTLKGLENPCLLYTSPSPRDLSTSRMPSSA